MSKTRNKKKALFFLLVSFSTALLAGFFFRDYKKFLGREASSYEKVSNSSLAFASHLKKKNKEEERWGGPVKFLPLYEAEKDRLVLLEKDFLEIDLEKMVITIFKNGFPEKRIDILTKGDAENWGGTAAGLYKVESGYRSAYSVASEVYMPWAVKFYGKYFIHGEPYYPGGADLVSDFSGGCLRLENEDARTVFEMTDLDMPVLVIDRHREFFPYEEKELAPFPKVGAKAFLAADIDSGTVLAERGSRKPLPVASITKLMTAIVLSENMDLTRRITIKEEMLCGYGTTETFEEGDKLRIIDLLYPLLVESCNDAAEALSYFLGKEETIALMNEKARSLMMEDTVFTETTGFDPGNISTARDLFYLARYISNIRPPIWKITKGEEVRSFGDLAFEMDELWNKNIFIKDPTFIGGKTGFIRRSKYNGLFVFRMKTESGDERRIAIITLGSENQKLDTQLIYLWLLENYFPETEIIIPEKDLVE